MATIDLDIQGIVPTEGYTPLPKGFYKVLISESSVDITDKGDGKKLTLTFKSIHGSSTDKIVKKVLTIAHPNQQTVDITKEELARICKAINFVASSKAFQSEMLHNIPLVIDVKIDGDYNKITKYLSLNEMAEKHPKEASELGLTQSAAPTFTPPPMVTPNTAPVFTPPVASPVVPPVFTQPAAMPVFTPPTPVAQVAPEVKYWISHPNINDGTPMLKPDKEVLGLVATGLFDMLVMTEDQSSGWKNVEAFGLVPVAAVAGGVPNPSLPSTPSIPGLPTATPPWNTAK